MTSKYEEKEEETSPSVRSDPKLCPTLRRSSYEDGTNDDDSGDGENAEHGLHSSEDDFDDNAQPTQRGPKSLLESRRHKSFAAMPTQDPGGRRRSSTRSEGVGAGGSSRRELFAMSNDAVSRRLSATSTQGSCFFALQNIDQDTSSIPSREESETLGNSKKLVQAVLSSPFPGIIMVLMFGYTYVAIITAGNDNLKPHAGFFLGWAQISNIAITSMAGMIGSTKWAIGGANTTSAILLSQLLKNCDNLETALVIQGIASLFTAGVFIGSAKVGGLGRLFGDRHSNTALYADYVHPSLVMALSHATALLMIKYSFEISVGGTQMQLNKEWWSSLFSVESVSVWVPAWVLGFLCFYLDIRLQRQVVAMFLLLIAPLLVFGIVAGILGLDNIPSHFYWQMDSSWSSLEQLDFSLVDGEEVARMLPLMFVSAIVIYAEAICVYKSWSVVVPERRSVRDDSMSCGVAHVFIGAMGGWFGHQTFVESVVNYQRGFRGSYLGGFLEAISCAGFGIAVFALQSPPPFPTILLSATVMYLAFVFIDIWFLNRLPPVVTIFEWMLSTAVVICVLVFGFNQGMAIGLIFCTFFVYATKTYTVIVQEATYDPRKGVMNAMLHGHMSHGNTTEIFDLILEASPKPREVSIDMTGVTSADSALALFVQSVCLMSKLESIHFVVRHKFPGSSSARQMLDAAAEAADGMIRCDVVLDASISETTQLALKRSLTGSVVRRQLSLEIG